MADPIVGFTPRDVEKLKAHLRRVKNDPVNQTGRPPTPVHSVYMDTSQAPEVYIVLVPAGGILPPEAIGTSGPPTSVTGTECQVYEITDDDGVLRIVDGLTIRVYNLSAKAIREGGWALAVREKGGEWIAIAQFGSSPGSSYGGGPCEFMTLNSNDCVLISYLDDTTGETEEYYLEYDSANSWWTSTEDFLYPFGGGQGVFKFFYDTGRFRLQLNGLDLVNCGDGCFSGSWITGHGPDETGTGAPDSTPCNASAFTVCVSCSCCPIDGWAGEGWYCVNDLSAGTGTGTSAEECEPIYLLEEDKCDDTLLICSGPYESEAAATAVCGTFSASASCVATYGNEVPANTTVEEISPLLNGISQWWKFNPGAGTYKIYIGGATLGETDVTVTVRNADNSSSCGASSLTQTTVGCFDVGAITAAQSIYVEVSKSLFGSGGEAYTLRVEAGTCP